MAAGGFKTFVAGEILTAADTNDFLMQGVLVFADAAARDAAITAPVEGQFAFLKDSDSLTFHNGTAFVALETETPPADISGGTVVTSGGYEYHTFTANGTLTVNTAGVADIMLVAGGGGGGSGNGSTERGGGGGAGGFYLIERYVLDATTFSIVIGAGGAGATASNLAGTQGNLSNFGTELSASFGGRGAGASGVASNGGSGGGASGGTSLFGLSVARTFQGFNGGQLVAGGNGAGGGGGGGDGANNNSPGPGTGGVGTTVFSDWGLATSTGEDSAGTVFFAGGGGGGISTGTVQGGLGGGGNGSVVNATNGDANTGGGGGGDESGVAGSGGSGIVIVRVEV